LQRESDIVESLSFALENASVYDISRLVSCTFFNNSEKIKVRISEKSCRYFEKIVLYLSKMVMFNSELAGMSFDLLAGGVTFIGLKTLEQADADVVAE
jgi:cyclin A